MPRAGFDDLGVSRSEIVTLNNYFIYFSHNFLVNSDSNFSPRSYNKLRTACVKCPALSIC